LGLSDIVGMLSDLAQIAVTILLGYVVFKIAKLIETLDDRIQKEK
jgi:hypothetical protein